MSVQAAKEYLQECINRGFYEPGAFDDFEDTEILVFAMHTRDRVMAGMFKESI